MTKPRFYALRSVENGESPHDSSKEHHDSNHHNAQNNFFERGFVDCSAVEHIHELSEIFGYEKLEHVHCDKPYQSYQEQPTELEIIFVYVFSE